MDFKKLKGLTIQDVIVEHHTVYDDDPTVVLWMDNGRKYRIEGGAEEGTDESANEWRGKLTLSSVNVKREPEFRVDNMEEVIYVSGTKGSISINREKFLRMNPLLKQQIIKGLIDLL